MNASPIKLIVGLGNPGEKYTKTRHNAGFLFLQRLYESYCGELPFKPVKQIHGSIVKTMIAEQECRLLMPSTFMNLSGRSVQAALSYYKLSPSQLLVVHDELDLDAGIARLKIGGGHGGNNGLRDIIEKLGTKEFARLRVGIGHPGVGKDVSSYVLKRPSIDQEMKIDLAIDESLRVIESVVNGDLSVAMNELHTRLAKQNKIKNIAKEEK